GAERRSPRGELGWRGRGPEGVAGVAQVRGETPHGGDDRVPGGPFRRAFQRALHEWLRGEDGRARRIEECRNGRPRRRVQRRGERRGRTERHATPPASEPATWSPSGKGGRRTRGRRPRRARRAVSA